MDAIKVIISLLASFPTYQKSLKDVYTIKFLTFLIRFWQISMRFQERRWYAALFKIPTREMVRNYRSRTRI